MCIPRNVTYKLVNVEVYTTLHLRPELIGRQKTLAQCTALRYFYINTVYRVYFYIDTLYRSLHKHSVLYSLINDLYFIYP